MTRRAWSLVLGGMLAGAACSTDPSDQPELHRGWYQLTVVEGGLLPQSVVVTSDCTCLIDFGSLFLSDTLFQLSYEGPLDCVSGPDGQTWGAFYTGETIIESDSVVFRMPDLSHLGLDSLNFTGARRNSRRIDAVVPQIPAGTGPPVRLVFDSTDAEPVPPVRP